MKKIKMAIALALACGFTMQGQLVKEMFNTASQPSTYTGYRAYGLQDVSWYVAQTPYNSSATPPTTSSSYVRALSVNPASMWWDPHPSALPTAGWITYPNTCSTGGPAYHGCLNDPTALWKVDQWYKISFYLCCDQDFCIDLQMWADNRIQEVYVNTTTNSGAGYWSNPGPGSGNPGLYQGYVQSAVVSESFCGDFHKGLNYMIIHVASANSDNSDYAGLLVNTTRISDCYGIIYNQLEEDAAPGARMVSAVNKKDLDKKETIVLNQNVPNPFAESTEITYTIPTDFTKAQILFMNLESGAVIKSFEITQKGKGSLKVFSDDLSRGIYSYQLVVDGKIIDTKKIVKQ